MAGAGDGDTWTARRGIVAWAAAVACQACQPGMSTTPAIAPAPPLAVGLPVFVSADPRIANVEDPEGRPIAVTLAHEVRDALEAAGFKLAATPEAAHGVVVGVTVQRIAIIHADLFLKGSLACGVRLEVTRAGSLVAYADAEAECVSTNNYYGVLPKDAAIAMVNKVSQAPGLVAVAEALHVAHPAPDAGVAPP